MRTARDIDVAMMGAERLLARAVADRDWSEAEALSAELVRLEGQKRLLEALGDTDPKQ
jgi:hypothetical protein